MSAWSSIWIRATFKMAAEDGDGGSKADRPMVTLTINDPTLAGPVLERLVSAAAARAEMPVDRVVNALTATDGLVAAADKVLGLQSSRQISVEIGDASLEITFGGLVDGQAEALREAAVLPDVGDVLERTAASVETLKDGTASRLAIRVD